MRARLKSWLIQRVARIKQSVRVAKKSIYSSELKNTKSPNRSHQYRTDTQAITAINQEIWTEEAIQVYLA